MMGLPINFFIPAPLQYMYQSQIVNRLIQQNIRRLQWGLCGADWVAGRLTGELGWQQIVLRALQKHGTVSLETRVSFTMNHYVCSSVECSCSLGLGQIFFNFHLFFSLVLFWDSISIQFIFSSSSIQALASQCEPVKIGAGYAQQACQGAPSATRACGGQPRY